MSHNFRYRNKVSALYKASLQQLCGAALIISLLLLSAYLLSPQGLAAAVQNAAMINRAALTHHRPAKVSNSPDKTTASVSKSALIEKEGAIFQPVSILNFEPALNFQSVARPDVTAARPVGSKPTRESAGPLGSLLNLSFPPTPGSQGLHSASCPGSLNI